MMQSIDLLRKIVSLLFYAWIPLCPAGVSGSLVDRHLQELRQARDGSLLEITIPESVGSLGRYAFENCYSLGSLFIDEGLPVIGTGAFKGCGSLTSVLISASLRYDVEEAFDDAVLENITLFRDNGYELIQMPFLLCVTSARRSFTP